MCHRLKTAFSLGKGHGAIGRCLPRGLEQSSGAKLRELRLKTSRCPDGYTYCENENAARLGDARQFVKGRGRRVARGECSRRDCGVKLPGFEIEGLAQNANLQIRIDPPRARP